MTIPHTQAEMQGEVSQRDATHIFVALTRLEERMARLVEVVQSQAKASDRERERSDRRFDEIEDRLDSLEDASGSRTAKLQLLAWIGSAAFAVALATLGGSDILSLFR